MACPYKMARRCSQADLHGIRVASEHLRPFAPSRAVAFVNHNVAEIVWRVEGGEKVGRALFRVNVKRLIGGNLDSCVSGTIAPIRILLNLSRVVSESVLKCSRSLRAKLVTITDEEPSPELSRVCDLPKNLNGDKRFAGAGGER